MVQLFTELAALMVLVFVISLLLSRIKQPLLVGYIVTGVLVGPIFLNFLSSPGEYASFAEIGVALLLFIVGLHLDTKLIKEVGTVSIVAGFGQILFTTLIGFGLMSLMGYGFIPSVIIALALTMSSTIVIVKLLSDTKGIDKLYGKISLGFLLIQDFFAVLLLMVIGSLSGVGGVESGLALLIGKTLLIGLGAIIVTILFGKFVVNPLLKTISSSKELLFLFIVAWCFGVAIGFSQIGFSLEIGALVAGVLLASSPYQHEISARIKPLRDFFIVLFFIFLGTQFIPLDGLVAGQSALQYVGSVLAPVWGDALLLSLFVLIGNPLIVFILIKLFGYSARTAFLSGIVVGQVSEFSLIFSLLAVKAGFLTPSEISLITLVTVITITASTYMIMYSEKLYALISPFLSRFDKGKHRDSLQGIQGKKHQIIIFGFDRIGFSLLDTVKHLGKEYLIVDHDPKIIKELKSKNVPVAYGDAGNVEFIAEFDFSQVELVISTIPDVDVSYIIYENTKTVQPNAQIVLTANSISDAMDLYDLGADYVILPHFLGGRYFSGLLNEFVIDSNRLTKEKLSHIEELHKRKGLGHDHPKK